MWSHISWAYMAINVWKFWYSIDWRIARRYLPVRLLKWYLVGHGIAMDLDAALAIWLIRPWLHQIDSYRLCRSTVLVMAELLILRQQFFLASVAFVAMRMPIWKCVHGAPWERLIVFFAVIDLRRAANRPPDRP
jgi:hypothetical protein